MRDDDEEGILEKSREEDGGFRSGHYSLPSPL